MKLFLDCEWANNDTNDINNLISLALVSERLNRVEGNFREQLYVEIYPQPVNLSDFAKNEVVPRLQNGGRSMPYPALAEQVREYVSRYEASQIVFDHPANYQALCQIVGNGAAASMAPMLVTSNDVKDVIESLYRANDADSPGGFRHNALGKV